MITVRSLMGLIGLTVWRNTKMETQLAISCLTYLSLFALCMGSTTNITCGGRLSKDFGMIVSPGYPDNYPSDMECEWIVSVTEGYVIRMSFEYMQMEQHDMCGRDWLEIRNGISGEDAVLLRACYYDRTPDPILTTGHHAYIRFISDSTFNYGGFQMNYFSFNETEAAARTTAASNLEPGQKAYPVRVTFELVVTYITFHPSHFSYQSLEDDVKTTLLAFLKFKNSKIVDVRIHEMSKSGLIVDSPTTTNKATVASPTTDLNSTIATNTTNANKNNTTIPTTTTATNDDNNNNDKIPTPQPNTVINDDSNKNGLIVEMSVILDTSSSSSSSDPDAVTGEVINTLIELSQAQVKVSGQPTPVRVTFGDTILSEKSDKCAVLQTVDPCEDEGKCVVDDNVARCSYDDQDEADLALIIGLSVGIPLLILVIVLVIAALFLRHKNGQLAA